MGEAGNAVRRDSAQLDRLQTLRFIAAAAIVVRHTFMELDQHAIAFPMRDVVMAIPWGAGVDVFFVISGFVITFGSVEKAPSAAASMTLVARGISTSSW